MRVVEQSSSVRLWISILANVPNLTEQSLGHWIYVDPALSGRLDKVTAKAPSQHKVFYSLEQPYQWMCLCILLLLGTIYIHAAVHHSVF